MFKSPFLTGYLVAAVLLLFAGTAQASAEITHQTHEVRPGDSLWALAQRTGCSVARLQAANDLRDDLIRIGDEIRLPQCRTPRTTLHIVQAGDTLSEIAADHGSSVQQLQRLNAMGNSTLIRTGQSLRLPAGVSSTVSDSRTPSDSSESIGLAWRGRLVGAMQLPHDPAYYRRRVGLAWGTRKTVEQVIQTIERVRAKHPHVHRLAVGDLSSREGGPLSGHRSHQSGRDVDLGLYFETRPPGYPQHFVEADAGRLALGPMWTLIDALARTQNEPGGAQYVFLDYGLQERIYRYARKRGVSKSKLRGIFQYPNGRGVKNRLVRHEAKHSDHLHVRFGCLPTDGRCE